MAICPTSIPYIKVAKNLLLNEFYLIVVLYYKIREIFQRKKVLSNTYVCQPLMYNKPSQKFYRYKTISTISHLDTCYPVEVVLLQA